MKQEASIGIQILPYMMEQENMIFAIDKVIDNIKAKGLKMQVCPFETVVEGTLNQMLEIIEESIYIASENGANDLIANIRLSYSKSGVLSIEEKTFKHR